MKQSLKSYHKYLDQYINGEIKKDKQEILEEILIQIKFFQHERLIHLIVTFFVGIAAILFLGFSLILDNIGMILLFFLAIALFMPYIFHYYYLENGTQALYKKYFIIKEK